MKSSKADTEIAEKPCCLDFLNNATYWSRLRSTKKPFYKSNPNLSLIKLSRKTSFLKVTKTMTIRVWTAQYWGLIFYGVK